MSKRPIDIETLTDATATAESDEACQQIAAEADALNELLDRAREVQWQSPLPYTSVVGGQPPRPTEDIALNPKRLALRAQVLASERAMREVDAYLRQTREALSEALTAYNDI